MTTEMKIEISMPTNNENANDDCIILVEASKLSLEDIFMSHEPKTEAENEFKTSLTQVIKTGIEDFYRPAMDPSFSDKEKTKIHYMAGEQPVVGKSYNWWKETVKDSKWCLGTKAQYVSFLGVLMKMMVCEGWTVDAAWDAVCNDSVKLGHYWDSDNAKHHFEDTGSREMYGFFDLANTHKILAVDEESDGFFWLASGFYFNSGRQCPLASLELDCGYISNLDTCSAWLVLKK